MGLAENPGESMSVLDNFKAGFDMTTMLHERQARIIYFGSMSDVRDEQRYAGYCQAMENAGLPTGRIAPNKVSSVSVAPA